MTEAIELIVKLLQDDPEEIQEWLPKVDTRILSNIRVLLFSINADVRTELAKRGVDVNTYYFSADPPE